MQDTRAVKGKVEPNSNKTFNFQRLNFGSPAGALEFERRANRKVLWMRSQG